MRIMYLRSSILVFKATPRSRSFERLNQNSWENKEEREPLNLTTINTSESTIPCSSVYSWSSILKCCFSSFSFTNFTSHLLPFFLGNPLDSNLQDVLSQGSEVSADVARKGLLVSLCFAYVNIHESQTPDPQKDRKMVVCRIVQFVLSSSVTGSSFAFQGSHRKQNS